MSGFRVVDGIFGCDDWHWESTQATLAGIPLQTSAGSAGDTDEAWAVDFRFANGWVVELIVDPAHNDRGDVGIYETIALQVSDGGNVGRHVVVRRDGMTGVPPDALLRLLHQVAARPAGVVDALNPGVVVEKRPAPPWFAQGFAAPVLPDDHRAALRAAAELLIDQGFDDICATQEAGWAIEELWLADYLPPVFLSQLTARHVRQFVVSVIAVAGKLARPHWVPLACLAEELALGALIQAATTLLALDGKEASFGAFVDAAFEDDDVDYLFSPADDGIEKSDIGARLGMGSLSLATWHATFHGAGGEPVHPYVEGDDYQVY